MFFLLCAVNNLGVKTVYITLLIRLSDAKAEVVQYLNANTSED